MIVGDKSSVLLGGTLRLPGQILSSADVALISKEQLQSLLDSGILINTEEIVKEEPKKVSFGGDRISIWDMNPEVISNWTNDQLEVAIREKDPEVSVPISKKLKIQMLSRDYRAK